jgi:hypothetical protein
MSTDPNIFDYYNPQVSSFVCTFLKAVLPALTEHLETVVLPLLAI